MATSEIKPVAKAAEALRTGWLAYLGVYGMAFDRAQPRIEEFTAKATDVFGELVAKGQDVETAAQDSLGDVRERTQSFYATSFDKAKELSFPRPASKDRVSELEAEIEALTKKVESMSKAPARKTTKRKAA